ncbi:uncharacterized protein LOC111713683 [Eurytemora carolleeae]|uniref:uncharacterized protein LOC111713683 n=1 Tax=Eurytemora carolleeae TaxID=1294199 RepID=UPI000C77D1C3|nr:uncharacterized protein LOC111713683 [Eurytemora carolleeae]|eukprot:XP_023344383.1 uncharacterized protein LOC111713683 [Eurytemora affinis]
MEINKGIYEAAGQGIGRESVIYLGREGATVWATDIRIDLLEQLKQENTTLNINISYVHQGSILECSDQVFERSYQINVRSMFWMCQTFIPQMEDGGSIINMSSVASSVKGAPNRYR